MIKFKSDLISEAKQIFPDAKDLHELMLRGDGTKAIDFIYTRLQFNVNEDDIIRAFRNKKEQTILEQAKRARAIRDFYQKVFAFVHKQGDAVAEKMGYEDCI